MEVKKTHYTLNWLLEKYLQNPDGIWDISQSPENADMDTEHIHGFGNYLSKKGFVKHHECVEDGFTCTITALGINQVSDMFSDVKYRILKGSIERKKRSLMEILDIKPGHYKLVHDFATYLKRQGLIECIFHHNDVLAEPTFFGKEWYQENKFKYASVA